LSIIIISRDAFEIGSARACEQIAEKKCRTLRERHMRELEDKMLERKVVTDNMLTLMIEHEHEQQIASPPPVCVSGFKFNL